MPDGHAGSDDPQTQPEPAGGWSESITEIENAVAVPPDKSDFVQPAGILGPSGQYCAQGALWRKFRPLTVQPRMPDAKLEKLPGRWLWGGVLWAHFGHFLVESTARLWALNSLHKPIDGILFIPKRPRTGEDLRGFQREFIDLMSPDIPVRVATRPMQVDELVVPGQGFGLGRITAGTPKYRDAIHARFAQDVQPEGPEKIYISRSALGLGKGGLLGEERLEELLEKEGYETFHPQRHNLATQLARYKAARKIVAADGSAIHLFAMVGRADQDLAIILRRKSSANNLLAANVSHFCGRDPVMISALRTEWVKEDGKQTSNRLSFGEIDHSIVGRELAQTGFIADLTDWSALTDEERRQSLESKGLTRENRFIESPRFARRRVRAMRERRRAARDAAKQP